MSERVIKRCHCGQTVVYDNPNVGCTNIGHFERTTGWFTAMDSYTQASLWICPQCRDKIQVLAQKIKDILRTADVSISSLLPFEERE